MDVGRVAIIGAGTMGRAISGGLIESGLPVSDIVMTAKSEATRSEVAADLGVRVAQSNVDAVRDAKTVIVAVKPKDVKKVLAEIADAIPGDTLLISIAAGVTLNQMQEEVSSEQPVIRAMPNTPCAIGRGVTVLSPGAHVSDAQLGSAEGIFKSLGKVFTLDETHMDTVTGLSASGPAFVFVFIESLADGAVARGLPRKVAIEMAAQMVFGAAAMVTASGKHPAALKDEVTTPAGCTIAGLLALEDGRIRSVVSRAIEIASHRASELGGPVH
jgi:pyrroline-5-carboxylate reductase